MLQTVQCVTGFAQGGVPFVGVHPETRGQARPIVYNGTTNNKATQYNGYKYFKFDIDGYTDEGLCNNSWKTSSYIVSTPGYPDKTYYYTDMLGFGPAEGMWNKLGSDPHQIKFWFGYDV